MKRTTLVSMWLFVLALACSFSNTTLACDLVAMVSDDGGVNFQPYNSAVSEFLYESDLRDDNQGWGFIAWDGSYNPFSYRTNTIVKNGLTVDPMFPQYFSQWNTLGYNNPEIFLMHSRKSSTFSSDPDPHPFIYKLNGRLIGLAHNGGIDSDQFGGIIDDLITEEYNGLDFLARYYSRSSRYLDSEVYFRYLMKNVLLAENYNLGYDWAINRSITTLSNYLFVDHTPPIDDEYLYSSLNMIMTDGKYLYAASKSDPDEISTHKLWTCEWSSHDFIVLSKDNSPGLIYDLVGDGDYISIEEGTDFIAPSYNTLSTVNDPTYTNYKLSSYDNVSTDNSEYVKVASESGKGNFCTVWQEDGAIKARVTNQLGLATQEEIIVFEDANVNAKHPNIVGNPDGYFQIVYVKTFEKTGRYNYVCYRELYQVSDYTDNDNPKYVDTVKWVLGPEIIINETPKEDVDVDFPAITTEGEMHCVVWQFRQGGLWSISGRLFTSSTWYDEFIFQSSDGISDCQIPDVVYTHEDDLGIMGDRLNYIVAWNQYGGSLNAQGVGAAKVGYLTTQGYYSNSAPITLVNLQNGCASMAFPALSGDSDAWLCTFMNEDPYDPAFYNVSNYKYYSRNYAIPLNPNGVTSSDPWYTPLAQSNVSPTWDMYPLVDNAINPDGHYEIVCTAVPITGFDLCIRHETLDNYDLNAGTLYNPYIDIGANSASDYVPRNPSIAISDDYRYEDENGNNTRRLIVWERKWNATEGRRITANFSPYHFRAGAALKEIGQPLEDITIPSDFVLEKAYPNPFNPTTTIAFSLPEVSHVNIAIYNINGQLVKKLVDSTKATGRHQVIFDGSNLSSGVYFVKMDAANYHQTMKIVLTK